MLHQHVSDHEIGRNQSVEHVFADIAGFDHAPVVSPRMRAATSAGLIITLSIASKSMRSSFEAVSAAQDHVGTIRSCGVALMPQNFIDLLGHPRRLNEGLATERP